MNRNSRLPGFSTPSQGDYMNFVTVVHEALAEV
jgi:hypothetical protein